MSNVAALITAIAALIAALAGLVKALVPLVNRLRAQPADGAAPQDRGSGGTRQAGSDQHKAVSRRTTLSLTCGVLAASVAVALVLLVQLGGNSRSPGLVLVLLATVGLLTLVGATAGVERAWAARQTDQSLARTASVGAVVGLAAWISALIVTVPLW